MVALMSGSRLMVQLSPSGMFKYAFHKIAQALESKDTAISVLEPADSNDVVAARFDLKDRSIVLLSPAPDTKEIDIGANVGSKPLPRVLARIRSLQQEDIEQKRVDVTYIIPLAESHNRQHWTTLIIKGHRCEFYDPRSHISEYSQFGRVAIAGASYIAGKSTEYSLEPLKKILRSANPPFIFAELGKNSFLKIQAIFDHNSCGYYIGWFIGKLAAAIKVRESILTMLAREQKYVPEVAELGRDYQASDNAPEFQQHIKGNAKICSALGFSTKADELSDKQLADAEFEEGEVVGDPNDVTDGDRLIHRSESLPTLKQPSPGEDGVVDDSQFQPSSPDATPPRQRPRRKSPPAPVGFWARNAQTIFWSAVAGAIVGLFLLSVIFPPAGGISGLLYSAAAASGVFAGGGVAAAGTAINETCYVGDSAAVEKKPSRSTVAKLAQKGVAKLDPDAHAPAPAKDQPDRRSCTRSRSVPDLTAFHMSPRRSMHIKH